MPKKLITKESYLIRATPTRKKWGGIWALDAFITLRWHKLDLLPDEVEIANRSGYLEIIPFEGNEDKEFISAEETTFATRKFPDNPTILQSVLRSDDEEEEDEEEAVVDAEEEEQSSDTVEAIMKRQESHFGVDTEADDEELTPKARKVKSGKKDDVTQILEE